MSDTFKVDSDVESTFKEIKYKDDINEIINVVNKESYRISRKNSERKKKRIKKIITRLSILILSFILAIGIVVFGITAAIRGISGALGFAGKKEVIASLLNEAEHAAQSYDYDKAIKIISSYGKNYEKNDDLKKAVINYNGLKSTLVKYSDNSQITHISFRTLIYDTNLAFDGDKNAKNYSRNMTTVNEFSNMLTELYNQNYILIRLSDIASVKNGKFTYNDLYLPQGKKPLIISQENVSYDESFAGDGFASKIIIDKDGKPQSEYVDENGKVSKGAFDLIPILEEFIQKNPGFSYKGARGVIGVTGSNGVLGYRTNANNENYISSDVKKAKDVATRLKDLGWEFACNSWDYIDFRSTGLNSLKEDVDRWKVEVGAIVGNTSILMFPYGNDIIKSGEYKENNEKFKYLKSAGFTYFCYGDNAQYSLTLGKNYLRQGRRVLSGYRLEYESEKLTDLFDIGRVIDIARPEN